jgi:hypothetical protein
MEKKKVFNFAYHTFSKIGDEIQEWLELNAEFNENAVKDGCVIVEIIQPN